MTTYNTIREAFENGFGDVFFKKDGKFVAMSRHDEGLVESMAAKGFEFVPFETVNSIAASEAPTKVPKVAETAKSEPSRKFVHYEDRAFREFYEEFPDAYGQNL